MAKPTNSYKFFIDGLIASFKKNDGRKYLIIGMAGVLLAFISVALINISVNPWLITLDEAAHLDYAWQISNFRLPEFYDGLRVPLEGINSPPVHWTSQHPPLFYLINSPIIRMALEVQGWMFATFLGRIAVLFQSTFLVLLVAASPFIIFKKNVYKCSLAAAMITVSLLPIIANASAFYNDITAIILSAAIMLIAIKMLIDGPKKEWIILLSLVGALGMLSRLSFASTLVLAIASIPVSYLIHYNYRLSVKVSKSIKYMVVVGLVVVALAGWFYLRNYQMAGNFHGGHSYWAEQNLNRIPKSLASSITQSRIWLHPVSNMFGGYHESISNLLFLISGIGILKFIGSSWRAILGSKARLMVIVFLALQVIFVVLQQVLHYSRGGGIQMRYFLPITLAMVIFLSTGLLAWKKLGWLLVSLTMLLGISSGVIKMIYLRTDSALISADDWFGELSHMISDNNLPFSSLLLFLLLCGVLIGLAVSVYSMFKLDSKDS